MITYPDQPRGSFPMDSMRKIVEDILEDELPDCDVNEWFLESVYFANLVDKIMEKIWENI